MQSEIRRHRQLFEAFRSVDESKHLTQSPSIPNQAFSVARLKEAAQAFVPDAFDFHSRDIAQQCEIVKRRATLVLR